MKTIVLAFAIWMAFNNTAGPGGNLQDLSSVDLTDNATPPGPLFAR